MGSYNGGGKMGKNSSQSGGLAGSAGNGNPGAGGKGKPAGDMGGFSTKNIKNSALKDLAPNSKISKAIGNGLNNNGNMGGPTIGSPSIPTVPSRTRTLNFNRAPSLDELKTMAGMVSSTLTGSVTGLISGATNSLNSGQFQGAVSQGNGQQESQGQTKALGEDNITEEEKKRRELAAKGTLLGAATIGNTLGTPMNPTPI